MATYSKVDIYQIGKFQKILPWLLLASLIAHFFPPALILTGIFCCVYGYLLAKAERSRYPLLWGLFCVLPVIGWVGIIILYWRAIRIFREYGLDVGILGVAKSRLQELGDSSEE